MHSKERGQLYLELFSTVTGKKVLEDLLEYVRYGQDVWNTDPITNSHVQGKQAVGVYIMNIIKEASNGSSTSSPISGPSSGSAIGKPDDNSSGANTRAGNQPGKHTHPSHGRYIP